MIKRDTKKRDETRIKINENEQIERKKERSEWANKPEIKERKK